MSVDLRNIDDALLAKYLQRETAPDENRMVELWRTASAANEEYFQNLRSIWQMDQKMLITETPDTDGSWKRFEKRADAKGLFESKRLWRKRIVSLAAALIVLGFSWFVLDHFYANRPVALASGNEIKADTLPDGSVVTLNKNTALIFADNRRLKKREVTITKGEGFFHVKPSVSCPFIVRYRGCEIIVLGTSFNVRTNDKELEVIVETGLVSVSRGSASLLLRPSEKIFFNVDSGMLKKSRNPDHLYDYYFTKEIKADKTPLWKVVDLINKKYNAKIVIGSEQLKDRQLTTVFKDQPLQQVLEVLTKTYNLKVTRKNDKIILE